MGRIRTPAIGGLVEDNPLASGATTLTSAGLAALPTFAAGDWGIITFDPDGRTGEPFSKKVTAHTAGATTATIEAAAIQGTARSIDRDVRWAVTDILDQDGNGAGLIAYLAYEPTTSQNKSTTSTTLVAVDTTNLRLPVVAPPSGKVLICLNARVAQTAGGYSQYWGLLVGGVQTGRIQNVSVSVDHRATCRIPVSGLTPGTSYNFDWGFAVDSTATANIYIHSPASGVGSGGAFMEAWAVNV